MRTMQVGAIDIQILPSLTANTVGGYLMSASLAAEFCRLLQTTKRMVPPDWAVNLFAMHEPAVAKATEALPNRSKTVRFPKLDYRA